jgi:putative transcriptional regulator
LTDGPFSQSVVLLLDHGEDGTLGVIINRATKIRLSEVLPELPGGKSHELFFGGPVGINGLLFVFRGGELPKGANHVMGDVYFSADKEVLDKLLEQRRRAEELHLYLGYAGWASGQLDWEISRGSWQLLRADARTVFEKDPETIWPDLVEDKSRKLIADGRLLE